ncbi:uncharacterized protein LOC100123806 [Nasonia vitripennis]|uniref:DUF4773 domain-containing protein n=1 Tax=Nasonia vitripennis TaxID=7425 RepID=A0A7M7LMR8_NASVI|nr:uncharacterized protein LOC100123806 [Nasonia vitripennis]
MDVKLLICLSGFFAVTMAARQGHAYFNSTAHALKVYGHSYYNPMTGEPLQGTIDDTGRLPFATPKISFRGLPCACVDSSCGCCAGLNISAIKFDRRYCANFTYDSSQLTIDMKVMMNENEIYKTSVSARNPPPVCVPLPYVPVLDFCLRLYDLSVPEGGNLQTCIDFETRLAQSPLLVMHFNCVRVGSQGISWVKPGDAEADANGTDSATPLAVVNIQPVPTTTEVYDEVNFEVADSTESDGYAINGTTLSPEEEDKIGEHRFTG